MELLLTKLLLLQCCKERRTENVEVHVEAVDNYVVPLPTPWRETGNSQQ